jgi:hypothetical protein
MFCHSLTETYEQMSHSDNDCHQLPSKTLASLVAFSREREGMVTLSDRRTGRIAKIKAPAKGKRLVFDDRREAPRGFGLRVLQAGSRVFVIHNAVDGRQRIKTIGDWPS